jgi:hypothetical protein
MPAPVRKRKKNVIIRRFKWIRENQIRIQKLIDDNKKVK